jgi:hypothetical protein
VLAFTQIDALVALLGAHSAAIIALGVYLIRTSERVTRLTEWARLIEKRLNGK